MSDQLRIRLETIEASALSFAVYRDPTIMLEIDATRFSSKPVRDLWDKARAIYGEHNRISHLQLVSDGASMDTLAQIHELRTQSTNKESLLSELLVAQAAWTADRLHATSRTALGVAPFSPKWLHEYMIELRESLLAIAASVRIEEIRRHVVHGFLKFEEGVYRPEAHWKLSTAIPDLDVRLNGGLAAGEFSIVLGRSGHGKSSLALTIALQAALAGHRSLYISREMLPAELSMRFAAALSTRRISEIQRALENNVTELRDEIHDGLAELPLDIDSDATHIDSIRALVESERVSEKPYKLVVLDFLQMIRSPGEEQHERFEHLAYACKDLAIHAGCHVLGLAQCKRVQKDGAKGGTGMPTMDDIRGSSAFENAADVLISMKRGESQGWADYPVALKVEKARNGRPGGLFGTYGLTQGTFTVHQLTSEATRVETIL